MKVLFICNDHYPYSGACTSLLNKMLFEGEIQKYFDKVHVLTIKKDFKERDVDDYNGITVHRCLQPIFLIKADTLQLLRKKPFLALRAICVKLASQIRRHLSGRESLAPQNVVNVLSKKLEELSCENYDIVIPICGYYETAVAALKGKWPIVLYQVDPCATNMEYGKKCPKHAIQLERKLYERAAAIITTPIIYQDICRNYPQEIIQKAHAMEFPNVSMRIIPPTKEKNEKITCLFAGSIYAIARNPRYTIEIFNKIQDPKIQLVFAGADQKNVCEFVDKSSFSENMTFLGRLPLEKAQEEIANADILVNIGNIMTNQVPSKIFEYISACKPIINICTNENCPSIPYLQKYPLALSIVEGVGTAEEHAKQIEEFVLKNAGCMVDKAVVLERFKECTAEYCAKQMVQVFTELMKKDGVCNE